MLSFLTNVRNVNQKLGRKWEILAVEGEKGTKPVLDFSIRLVYSVRALRHGAGLPKV
jgi:hypothetical protein